MRLLRLLLPCLVLSFIPMIAPAQGAGRVALVIGNSQYTHVARLTNPDNDAKLIAQTLRGLGFTLIGNGPQLDLDKAAMDRAVQSFGKAMQGADVALFYYAGHGLQIHGQNFLVPVGANPTRESDADFQMLNISLVLHQMEDSGTRLNIVILDACRNNPFGGRGLRSAGGGLAQMQAPDGTVISFATQPGNVALDGNNGHSPFSRALADTLRRPGLDIFRTFNQVGLAVKRATGGAQQPWVSSSPISGDFYFAGRQPGNTTPQAVSPAPTLSAAAQAWDVTKDTDSPAVLKAFIKQFPNSVFAGFAKARLSELVRQHSPPSAPGAGGDEDKVAMGKLPVVPRTGAPTRQYVPGDSFSDCAHCPQMVVVPAGHFMMGSASYERGRSRNEGPQHKVTIGKPFAIGKFEVTFGEFMAFARATHHRKGYACDTYEHRLTQKRTGRSYENPGFRQSDRNPVVCVSWADIQAYLAWLSKKTDKRYRLPSEAEWEYAARSGTTTAYFFGNDVNRICKYANADDASTHDSWRIRSCNDHSGEAVTPVGHYLPNGFGLYDTVGNVWEYVADCWTANYRNAPTDGSTVTKRGCNLRIMRGGSWANPATGLRSAFRRLTGDEPVYNKGFRVVRDLDASELR